MNILTDMTEVNKTLYIPLYGKALVSKKNVILSDKRAERIWDQCGFTLKRKSASRWLAYYMGMRSRVFDDWVRERLSEDESTVAIHLGCGLDSRIERVGTGGHSWFDVDFPEVIEQRRHYFGETGLYKMIGCDIREEGWLKEIGHRQSATVIMEGVSMYLSPDELSALILRLSKCFDRISLLMDSYTTFAAKASKIKNPINDVGVTQVYGFDDPLALEKCGISFVSKREMTPDRLINELSGMERSVFRSLYAGKMSKKLYKLYEYKK